MQVGMLIWIPTQPVDGYSLLVVELFLGDLRNKLVFHTLQWSLNILLLGPACKEGEWLKYLLMEIRLCVKPIPSLIFIDSQATLACARAKAFNEKTRHIRTS